MNDWRVRGIRGAITVKTNTPAEITQAAKELVEAVVSENRIAAEDMVSIIFTATPDLNAEFPAVGARMAGLTSVPLLCMQEIPVPDGQAMCIRALFHVTTTLGQQEVRHVYLKEARKLRPDLPEPGNKG